MLHYWKKVTPIEDPIYHKWEAKDTLVKSWLVNSMIDKLMCYFVPCETAKEV